MKFGLILENNESYVDNGTYLATDSAGRDENEDGCLLATQTRDDGKKFELLAVADALGGEDNGKQAQELTLVSLNNKFQEGCLSMPNLFKYVRTQLNNALQLGHGSAVLGAALWSVTEQDIEIHIGYVGDVRISILDKDSKEFLYLSEPQVCGTYYLEYLEKGDIETANKFAALGITRYAHTQLGWPNISDFYKECLQNEVMARIKADEEELFDLIMSSYLVADLRRTTQEHNMIFHRLILPKSKKYTLCLASDGITNVTTRTELMDVMSGNETAIASPLLFSSALQRNNQLKTSPKMEVRVGSNIVKISNAHGSDNCTFVCRDLG